MGSGTGADAALVLAAQSGDAGAFGELYERYRQPVYRYCLARSSSPHEAEDLVSEVFLKAMESLARYRDKGLPFIAFLYRVARNAAIDRSRKDRGASLFDMTIEPRSSVDVEGDAARASDMETVLAALRKIKPEYREVILLRFVEGYSAADVAIVLDKAEKAVWNLQQRGLERLRKELKRSGAQVLAGLAVDR
ncbi:MAG TPA: RNA polymerase sigma factor [Candidatus Saccharimonadales bacterium]|nr:RNA polymerase sigma factor [Candidatus Saccharimonadales bacterium]